MKTSISHPLAIAEISVRPGSGKIGITFCPGKKDPYGGSGSWDRDLCLDVEAVGAWGAAVVVTLLEDHELDLLELRALGDEIRRNHMEWLHLPIRDVSTPDAVFEQTWTEAGERLRDRLRSGFAVVVHCRGGLGRAGMIAASLLVELGWTPDAAIAEVRRVRPGAIETEAQAAYVQRQSPVAEAQPSTSAEAIEDRAVGAFVGLAVGDAVGTTLEFRARDSYPPLDDMVGGGPFNLRPGEWTDDTAMALALADSLLETNVLDERDLTQRFLRWRDEGVYSCTDHCFDIGNATSAALSRWARTGDPRSGSSDPRTAGNGSLMRLAPVALCLWRDRSQLRDVAARQSKTTHAAPEAVDACVIFAEMLADAIEGRPRSEVLRDRSDDLAGNIRQIAKGSWRGRHRNSIRATGYVAHSLEASLWSIGRTADYRSAIFTAANLGEDADTTAAITGQLAGALYGVSKIPRDFVKRLAWSSRIHGMATDLARRGMEEA